MDQYIEKGKEVLKILINNGTEAYIIGEAVYSVIRESSFPHVDIITNATPEMVKGIFTNAKVEDHKNGSVKLQYLGYTFYIRTFRLEEKYKDNRKPAKIHYSKNLKDELAACDFTINALAMSYGGKLTDAYKGYSDLKRKRIRTIGAPKVRFKEDPLRILIAIRLASELGFKIDRKTLMGMKKRSKLLANLAPTQMVEELSRIFSGKYFKKALKYFVETRAYKYIPELRKGIYYLYNNYRRISIDTILATSFVLNKQFSHTWNELSDDHLRMEQVVELALSQPKGKYDDFTLFRYGLDVSLDSNYVNHLLGKSRLRSKRIRRNFEALIVKDIDEINFSRIDFFHVGRDAENYFDKIMMDVVKLILSGDLNNTYPEIKDFVIGALRVNNVHIYAPGEEPTKKYEELSDHVYREPAKEEDIQKFVSKIGHEPETISYEDQEVAEYTELPATSLEQLHRKVIEFEKTLREKDEKIKQLERQALEFKLDSDVNTIVDQNLELLKDLEYIGDSSEKILVQRELKEVYKGIMKNTNPKYKSLAQEKEGNRTDNETND